MCLSPERRPTAFRRFLDVEVEVRKGEISKDGVERCNEGCKGERKGKATLLQLRDVANRQAINDVETIYLPYWLGR